MFNNLGTHFRNATLKKSNCYSTWFFPLILLGLTAIAHGLFATRLGFHWDDWGFAWVRYFRGDQGLLDVFAVSRPLQGYVEGILTNFLGVNPLVWQVYSLFTRWLATVAFWWLLNQIWPANRQLNMIATLFFLVYPGFTQQPLAQTYDYFWAFEALFFVSLGLMVKAIRASRISLLLMGGAVVLSLLQLFSTEYLFGLELFRPVLIWLLLGTRSYTPKQRLVRTIQYYIPFVCAMGVYLFWRFGVYTRSFYQPLLLGEMQKDMVHTTLDLTQTVLRTSITVSAQAWIKIFQLPPENAFSISLWAVYIAAILGTFVGLLFSLNRMPSVDNSVERQLSWKWIAIGLLSILEAGIPFYIAQLPVRLEFPEDRLTLPFMFGVSLLLAGILGLFPARIQKSTLASLLVALAIGVHIYTNNLYRSEWRTQQSFIWQLTWRAPALKPGTSIVTEDIDTFPYDDDEGLAFAINWVYDPTYKGGQIPFAYFFASARLGNAIPAFKPGQPIEYDFLFSQFESTTDQMIFLEYNPPSCLHVLTSAYDGDKVTLMLDRETPWRREKTEVRLLPELALAAISLSNPNQIITNTLYATHPPEFLFGREPAHQWCYYYEKADLARQTGDWEEVVRIADRVFAIPYYPDDYYEYLLFIDGYVRLHRWEEAQTFTKKVVETGPVLRPALCSIWQGAEQSTGLNEEDKSLIRNMKNGLGVCPFP